MGRISVVKIFNENFSDIYKWYEIKIILFENNSLKLPEFNFGTNIIIQDICKITSLSKDIVREILNKIKFNEDIPENELISKFLKMKFIKRLKKNLFLK